MTEIGRIELVPIRKAFPKEAHNFTTWMEQNIEALADRLGLQLKVEQREKKVGDFNVDLLCEDAGGHPVIIENQLEQSDHDHMGKLLTYMVNLDAKTAIWVVTDARQEHLRVVDWLNESTPSDVSFYMVKVEAMRIGDSPFGPLFTALAAPDAQVKVIGEDKKEWAERHFERKAFWEELLEKAKDRAKFFSNISPSKASWIGTGAGKSGVTFNFVVNMDSGAAELYIDHDQETGDKNKSIFDQLHAQKSAIEKECGFELEWERLDQKRACRIRRKYVEGGLSTKESWPALQEKMIEAMVALEQALRPRLAKVNI